MALGFIKEECVKDLDEESASSAHEVQRSNLRIGIIEEFYHSLYATTKRDEEDDGGVDESTYHRNSFRLGLVLFTCFYNTDDNCKHKASRVLQVMEAIGLENDRMHCQSEHDLRDRIGQDDHAHDGKAQVHGRLREKTDGLLSGTDRPVEAAQIADKWTQ